MGRAPFSRSYVHPILSLRGTGRECSDTVAGSDSEQGLRRVSACGCAGDGGQPGRSARLTVCDIEGRRRTRVETQKARSRICITDSTLLARRAACHVAVCLFSPGSHALHIAVVMDVAGSVTSAKRSPLHTVTCRSLVARFTSCSTAPFGVCCSAGASNATAETPSGRAASRVPRRATPGRTKREKWARK